MSASSIPSAPARARRFATELPDAASTLDTVHRRLLVRQERAGALLRGQHFTDFELSIGADYSVGIDRQVDGKLPHRGELIARAQRSGRDSAQHLIDDLAISRNAAALIQRELDASIGGFERRRQVIVY